MTITKHDNLASIERNWDHPITLEADANLTKLLHVLASENQRIDLELESLYDNLFVGSATGYELEQIGRYVGIVRKTDEGDDKLRVRIRGGFASQASDTTYESFATSAITIIGADATAVEFVTPPDTVEPKTVELRVDGAALDEHPLTIDELQILLNGALSVDARCEIIIDGNFAFAGDDTSLAGFDEGTWSNIIE